MAVAFSWRILWFAGLLLPVVVGISHGRMLEMMTCAEGNLSRVVFISDLDEASQVATESCCTLFDHA